MPISIDTRQRRGRARGARSGRGDHQRHHARSKAIPRWRRWPAKSKCAVVLMHMRGGPADHIKFARYRDVVREVTKLSCRRARDSRSQRESRDRASSSIRESDSPKLRTIISSYWVPCRSICALGYPVLVGASRKNFVPPHRGRWRGRYCIRNGRGERPGDRQRESRSSGSMILDRRWR